ncbi:hypothetical protein TRVA0_023S00782 [Trichomonascus vanleenenianus]|uniref:uncharacterized protein n=1 Tax=Trichomonascus vanleenenianus TaxID=2268995 RepID=UPI003ECB0590
MGACLREKVAVFKPFENEYLAKLPNTLLDNHAMPPWGVQLLRTEADVISISEKQLMLPVEFALNEICPEGHVISVMREHSVSKDARFDMHFELFSLITMRPVKILAVVEFKNTNVLNKEDFEAAFLTKAAYKGSLPGIRRREGQNASSQYALSAERRFNCETNYQIFCAL